MKYSGITEHNKAAFDAIVPRVNEAIESGEIAIPAGGTQLYKHTVKFSSPSLTINIYSLDSTPLTAKHIGKMAEISLFAHLDTNDNNPIISFFADSNDNYQEKIYYVNTGGASSTSNMFVTAPIGTFVSDIVTPL